MNESLSDEFRQSISVLGKVANIVAELPLCASEPLIWTVDKWAELKKKAASESEAIALCEGPKYIYGYSIQLGVKLKRKDGGPTFHSFCHVCQGAYDSLLNWPLRKKLQLTVLNSEGEEILQPIRINTTLLSCKKKDRPTSGRNDGFSSRQFLKVTDIETTGCVKNDKVLVKSAVSQL